MRDAVEEERQRQQEEGLARAIQDDGLSRGQRDRLTVRNEQSETYTALIKELRQRRLSKANSKRVRQAAVKALRLERLRQKRGAQQIQRTSWTGPDGAIINGWIATIYVNGEQLRFLGLTKKEARAKGKAAQPPVV